MRQMKAWKPNRLYQIPGAHQALHLVDACTGPQIFSDAPHEATKRKKKKIRSRDVWNLFKLQMVITDVNSPFTLI